jgi:hypothetical protein
MPCFGHQIFTLVGNLVGKHLPAFLSACNTANEGWMRSCAAALTYALAAHSKSGGLRGEGGGGGRLAASGAPASSCSADRDGHVQDCLCVLLQRMSARPACRSLFPVAGLHGVLLESSHACSTEPQRAFFRENVACTIHNLR